jgi:DNA modification methylase
MDYSDWLNRCHFGDVRAVLRRMAADGVKVQTIVTSPPYWGLRSYLPAGHADKVHEIGSEPTLSEAEIVQLTGYRSRCHCQASVKPWQAAPAAAIRDQALGHTEKATK